MQCQEDTIEAIALPAETKNNNIDSRQSSSSSHDLDGSAEGTQEDGKLKKIMLIKEPSPSADIETPKKQDYSNITGQISNPNWKALAELDSLPLMKSGYSLEADMKFGWKPTVKGKVLPIPLVFDSDDHLFDLDHYMDSAGKKKYPVLYQGWRPADSFKMYKRLLANSNQYHGSDFNFKVPSELPVVVQKLLDQQMQERVLGGAREQKSNVRFEGMNPEHWELYSSGEVLQFDGSFECGNLDRVVMVSPTEYDIYMRPDTNTRGHHQWFFFRAISKTNLGAVKFNILNFTKERSLYEYGMKVCVKSVKETQIEVEQMPQKTWLEEDLLGWKRGGYDIEYKRSKLNKIIERHCQEEGNQQQYFRRRYFYQMSFTYNFDQVEGDETYFAYSFPYSFTRLSRLIKSINTDRKGTYTKDIRDATPLCSSLSGVDVPYLIVTSRANQENFNLIDPSELPADSLPVSKTKKTVVLTGRVHPGESNSSYMMEGFIKFITSPVNKVAQELRSRLIFRIIPCVNPDGVMAGNYRVSMSGNDLNRRYQTPHQKLHPIVCAVKKLIKEIQQPDSDQILCYIDMHGHSRKKNVFMYGPQFPIHDGRYIQMRVLPKLMSEQSEMFRYYSCKFRLQKSKEKTARVVLWREFSIMNCFTLEASFQGYFNHARLTRDFTMPHFLRVGEMLANTIYEYQLMRDEDDRQKKARKDFLKLQKSQIKQSQSRKRADNSKAVLSPSASSETMNIDDQQPGQQVESTKLHHIRKKLQNAQKQSPSKEKLSSNQKRKFKVTKQFKDDMPPIVHKKNINPNQPPEEEESEQEQPQAPPDSIFRPKKRTLKDLCNEIQLNENEQPPPKDKEEINSSDGGVPDGNGTFEEDESDDDQMLQKIQHKIIDVLNYDNPKPSKPPLQQIKEKKPIQSVGKVKHNIAQQIIKEKPLVHQNSKKHNVEPKLTSKRQTAPVQQISLQPARNQLYDSKKQNTFSSSLKREDSNFKKTAKKEAKRKASPIVQSSYPQTTTKATSQQGVAIPMTNNNFNDRIITQQYNKHKKQNFGGAGYHLSTLSANAQQLLQQQLQQEHNQRQQQLQAHKKRQQGIDDKAFSYYNFQARRDVPSITLAHQKEKVAMNAADPQERYPLQKNSSYKTNPEKSQGKSQNNMIAYPDIIQSSNNVVPAMSPQPQGPYNKYNGSMQKIPQDHLPIQPQSWGNEVYLNQLSVPMPSNLKNKNRRLIPGVSQDQMRESLTAHSHVDNRGPLIFQPTPIPGSPEKIPHLSSALNQNFRAPVKGQVLAAQWASELASKQYNQESENRNRNRNIIKRPTIGPQTQIEPMTLTSEKGPSSEFVYTQQINSYEELRTSLTTQNYSKKVSEALANPGPSNLALSYNDASSTIQEKNPIILSARERNSRLARQGLTPGAIAQKMEASKQQPFTNIIGNKKTLGGIMIKGAAAERYETSDNRSKSSQNNIKQQSKIKYLKEINMKNEEEKSFYNNRSEQKSVQKIEPMIQVQGQLRIPHSRQTYNNRNTIQKHDPIFHSSDKKEMLSATYPKKSKKLQLEQDAYHDLQELTRVLGDDSAKFRTSDMKQAAVSSSGAYRSQYTMDNRRVHLIKSQIRVQQEKFNQRVIGGLGLWGEGDDMVELDDVIELRYKKQQ